MSQQGRKTYQLLNPGKTASRIRESRKKAGLTIKELADKLEVSFDAVRSWENGRHQPEYFRIEQICEICSVPKWWLMCNDEMIEVIQDSKKMLASFDPDSEHNFATETLLQAELLDIVKRIDLSKLEGITDSKLFREYMESSIRNSIEFYIKNLNKEKEPRENNF